MSTLSCQLLVSSALTEDIYRTFCARNASRNRSLVWVGRAISDGHCGRHPGIASDPEARCWAWSYAWAGFGAAFGPVIILSLFWSPLTRNGALAW
jgi:sodium/proline symporter